MAWAITNDCGSVEWIFVSKICTSNGRKINRLSKWMLSICINTDLGNSLRSLCIWHKCRTNEYHLSTAVRIWFGMADRWAQITKWRINLNPKWLDSMFMKSNWTWTDQSWHFLSQISLLIFFWMLMIFLRIKSYDYSMCIQVCKFIFLIRFIGIYLPMTRMNTDIITYTILYI